MTREWVDFPLFTLTDIYSSLSADSYRNVSFICSNFNLYDTWAARLPRPSLLRHPLDDCVVTLPVAAADAGKPVAIVREET